MRATRLNHLVRLLQLGSNLQVSIKRQPGDDGNKGEHQNVAKQRPREDVNTEPLKTSPYDAYSRGVLKANCNP